MSDKTDTVLLATAALLLVLLIFLYYKKEHELQELRSQLDANQQITDEVRKRLRELIDSGLDVDSPVVQELLQIIPLLEIKQESKAILALAKIIENLLRELYRDDVSFHSKFNKRSNGPNLYEYLEHARGQEIISMQDYHLLSILRLIRNEEAHELDVEKEGSRIAAALLAGISFVFKFNPDIAKCCKS